MHIKSKKVQRLHPRANATFVIWRCTFKETNFMRFRNLRDNSGIIVGRRKIPAGIRRLCRKESWSPQVFVSAYAGAASMFGNPRTFLSDTGNFFFNRSLDQSTHVES
jgi:hypothetical protein